MGGRSSTHIVSYQTVYIPNPVVEKKLVETQQQLTQMQEQARAAGDPKLYAANASKLLTNFVDHIHELKLTDVIKKNPGEKHIGVIGDISSGKSTFLNAMFSLNLPVALGHCTTQCEPVHKIKRAAGDIVFWDLPGKNDDFRFYIPENLSFVKSLDTCIVLYDNDIAMIRDVLKIVDKLCPGRMIAVRTKLDQYNANNARTPAEEKIRDNQQIATIIGHYSTPLYFVSSHNIQRAVGDRYDWDALKTLITQ